MSLSLTQCAYSSEITTMRPRSPFHGLSPLSSNERKRFVSLCSQAQKNEPGRIRWLLKSENGNNSGSGEIQSFKSFDDTILNFMSDDSEVSVYVVTATKLVREAQLRHSMAPTATAALGRLLVGTLLLGALKGAEEIVQVSFHGRGELGQMTAVTQNGRFVKGFAFNPLCNPPVNSRGKLDVGTAVGPGVLTVVRSHPAWQQPYSGSVPLQTGEVAEDLAHYLAESEQINTALSLGVLIGRDCVVQAAGGFLVQVLPNCSEETLNRLEANVAAMPPISELIASAHSAHSIAERILEGLGRLPGNPPVEPLFGPCSVEELKPRMLRAVESLGRAEVESLLAEQGRIEVRCEFCSEDVHFEAADLKSVLQV